MRLLFASLAMGALCSCTQRIAVPDAGSLVVDGRFVMNGVALGAGDYAWTVAAPPQLGREVFRIERTETDTWLLGYGVYRWDGQALTEAVPPAPLVRGVLKFGSLPFVDHLAAFGANDVWACGSQRLHWNGATWEDSTPTDGGLASPFNCVVAAYGPNRLRSAADSSALERYTPAGGWERIPVSTGLWDRATGAPLNGSLLTGSGCTEVGPAGELLVLGLGVVTVESDASQPYGVKLWVTQALRDPGQCRGLRRAGADTWYSIGGGRVQSDPDQILSLSRAVLPGDFEAVGWLRTSALTSAGLTLHRLKNASGNPEYLAAAVAPIPDGALYVFRGADLQGRGVSFLVELKGSTVRILPDRLYGWEAADLAVADGEVLVAAQGGALLKGVKR